MRTLSMTMLVSVGLALSACGGEGGPGPTAGTDQATPSSTPSSSSTSRSGTSSSSAPSSSSDTGRPFDATELTDTLQEAVDAHPTVTIDVRIGPEDQPRATATGVQDLDNDALEMTVDVGDQEMTYRLVDGQYYLAQDPKWVPVTKDSTNPLIKQALDQTELLSMRRQLDAFIAAVESAGDKGPATVDGVSTRHYTATVDTDTLFEELDLTTSPGSPDTATYDIWLDDEGLIRKMSFTQDGADATLLASDWGKPVSITTPKPSELATVR